MTTTNTAELLVRAAWRARTDPAFVAHDLAAAAHDRHAVPGLGADPVTLARLALCRTPRRGPSFAEDLRALADYIGLPSPAMARLFRLADALGAARSLDGASESKVMAAARDVDEEQTAPELPPAGSAALPAWLSALVERFWGAEAGPDRFPRDLDLAVMVSLPVAVVEIAGLSVASLRSWLADRHVAVLEGLRDRPLRACVVAYGGVGIAFVDADDTPTERRVSLAHEAGHFLNDYLVAYERLARRAPDLLEVVDGLRPPTSAERVDALLARVPLGLHAHLLERTAGGALVAPGAGAAEERAEVVAWELLAPRHDVLDRVPDADLDRCREVLVGEFGLPRDTAELYAHYLHRVVRGGHRQSVAEMFGLAGTDVSHFGADERKSPRER